MIKWLLIDVKPLPLLKSLDFARFNIYSNNYDAYNWIFSESMLFARFLWGGRKGSVPYLGRLLRNGGGILHKCLTLIFS